MLILCIYVNKPPSVECCLFHKRPDFKGSPNRANEWAGEERVGNGHYGVLDHVCSDCLFK